MLVCMSIIYIQKYFQPVSFLKLLSIYTTKCFYTEVFLFVFNISLMENSYVCILHKGNKTLQNIIYTHIYTQIDTDKSIEEKLSCLVIISVNFINPTCCILQKGKF